MKHDRHVREALIDSLEVGDLIRLNSRLRVVRGVSLRNRRITSITLSIQRVSWTRRPYTVINRSDLYLCQLDLVKKGHGLGDTSLAKTLQTEIDGHHSVRLLGPEDVIGVID